MGDITPTLNELLKRHNAHCNRHPLTRSTTRDEFLKEAYRIVTFPLLSLKRVYPQCPLLALTNPSPSELPHPLPPDLPPLNPPSLPLHLPSTPPHRALHTPPQQQQQQPLSKTPSHDSPHLLRPRRHRPARLRGGDPPRLRVSGRREEVREGGARAVGRWSRRRRWPGEGARAGGRGGAEGGICRASG